jgi:hypothetical protein
MVYGRNNEMPASELRKIYDGLNADKKPNYIVFMQAENLDRRIAEIQAQFPTIAYETTIEPSYIDKLVHWQNPINRNQTSYIYRIK